MEQMGTDLVLVCSANYPDAVDDDEQIAEQLHRLATRAAGTRHADLLRGAGLVDATSTPTSGPGTSSAPPTTPRWACASTASTSCPAGSDPAGIEGHPRREAVLPATGRCAVDGHGPAAVEPAPPAVPRPGRVRSTGLPRPRAAPPATPGRCRSRSSTTSSGSPIPRRAAVDAHRSLLALHEATVGRLPTGPCDADRRARAAVPTLGGFAFAELAVDDDSSPAVAGHADRAGFHPFRAAPQQAGAALAAGRRQGAVERVERAGRASDRCRGGRARPGDRRPHRRPPSGPRRCSRPCCPAAADRPRRTCPPSPRRTGRRCSSAAPAPTTRPAGCRTSRRPARATARRNRRRWASPDIDHVALTQPYDRFDEAALFYRTVLGLQTQHNSEIAAPFGLVRNRAVANPDGTVRVCLSVSVLRRGNEWQPGVTDPQHVAFATDDIFAAARAAKAAGAPLVQVPANYYDDLDARLAPPSSQLSGHARAERAARSERRRASSCTSTPRCSAVGSSSRSCSGSAGTPVTARSTRPCGWPPTAASERLRPPVRRNLVVGRNSNSSSTKRGCRSQQAPPAP